MKRLTISILAVAAAMLASGQPAMAASCNGNGHQVVLSNGSATPGAGTTATPIRFSVRYADTAGCAPSRVVVVVQGVGTYPLSGSGSDYAAGATFSRTLSLPAGSHAYSFKATSGKKAGSLSSVSPSKVTITAPTPRPTPTPPPPPPPTPKPAAVAPPPHHRRRRQPRHPLPARPHRQRPALPARHPAARRSRLASSRRPRPPSTDGGWRCTSERPLGRPGGDRPRTPGAALEFVPELQPPLDDIAPFGILASFGITTVGGLAFFFILLRTRRGNPLASQALMTAAVPSAQVSASASSARTHAPTMPAPRSGSGSGTVAPRVSPLPPMRDLIPPIDYDLLRDPDERSGPAAGEADIPRWLRPSVRAGRFGEEPTRRRDWGD